MEWTNPQATGLLLRFGETKRGSYSERKPFDYLLYRSPAGTLETIRWDKSERYLAAGVLDRQTGELFPAELIGTTRSSVKPAMYGYRELEETAFLMQPNDEDICRGAKLVYEFQDLNGKPAPKKIAISSEIRSVIPVSSGQSSWIDKYVSIANKNLAELPEYLRQVDEQARRLREQQLLSQRDNALVDG